MSKSKNDNPLIDISNANEKLRSSTPKKKSRSSSISKTKTELTVNTKPFRRSLLFDDPDIQSSIYGLNLNLVDKNSVAKTASTCTEDPRLNRLTQTSSGRKVPERENTIERPHTARGSRKSDTEEDNKMAVNTNPGVSRGNGERKKPVNLLDKGTESGRPEGAEVTRKKSIPRELLRSLTRNDKSEVKSSSQQPTGQELDKQLETMMIARDYGEIEKNKLRGLTKEQKWVILTDYYQSAKIRLTPRDYISNLRKKSDESSMEHLLLDIKCETVNWIKEFVKLGGVSVITKILEEALEKQKKNRKPKEYQLIQNSIFVLKALMQVEEGIKAVSESFKTLQLLFVSLDLAILSERTKVHLLHILAAISTVDQNAHKAMISILEKSQLSFISLSCSVNEEVATACFICLNAILNSSKYSNPKCFQLKQFLLDKGLNTIIKQWQTQEISVVFQKQLQIFLNIKNNAPVSDTNSMSIDSIISNQMDMPNMISNKMDMPSMISNKMDMPSMINYQMDMAKSTDRESPLYLTNQILDRIKDTPMYNQFVSIMIYLMDLNPDTKIGKNKWELINLFVKFSTLADGKDKNEVFNNVFSQFKSMHTGLKLKSELIEDNSEETESLKSKKKTKKHKKDKITSETSFESVSETTGSSLSEVPLPPGRIPPPPAPGCPAPPPPPGTRSSLSEVPPPPGCIPPPPPPPGCPAPPPPPGCPAPPPPPGMPKAIPKKEIRIKPDIKMRPFHWNKLNINAVNETIWGRMSSDIKFPKFAFQSEFAFVEQDSHPLKESSQGVAQDINKTIIVLDQKRWQNISILLNKFPIKDFNEIRIAISNMDDDKLNLDLLQLLTPFSPLPSEMESLKPFQDTPNLGIPERFFLVLMEVPEVGTRLELWQYKLNFKNKQQELQEKMESLINACVEVRNSEKFSAVLEIILYMGNFMNCNSSKGGAWGFKLDTLSKLSEIKSKKNSELSLLHFLVEYLLEEYPELCDFYHDLKSVEKIKELQQITNLNSETQVLESHLLELGDFMAAPVSEYGQFRDYMEPFMPVAQQHIDRLKSTYKKSCQEYSSLIEFFGETKGLPVGSFFDTIRQFLFAFENMKFKISRKVSKVARKNLGKMGVKLPTSISNGTLDRVIADLSSGQAFDIS